MNRYSIENFIVQQGMDYNQLKFTDTLHFDNSISTTANARKRTQKHKIATIHEPEQDCKFVRKSLKYGQSWDLLQKPSIFSPFSITNLG